ncbi:MAG TPA: hypothetical protein VFN74_18990 [Chloroflexota bacterium]|nr:hypothetical protein [Chloroflexota bacterium]
MEQPLAQRPDADAPLTTRDARPLATSPSAPLDASTIEQVVVGGDLARLTPAQRVSYYQSVCQSLGLNPLTRPFEYIRLNDKLTLYAKREATDQLRKLHNISVEILSREQQGDLYVITTRATTPDGRTDEATGAVPTAGLSGVNLANALLKAETKAKRRVTLSICGLGWLDESEVDSVRVARPAHVSESGELYTPDPTQEKLLRRWQALTQEATSLARIIHRRNVTARRPIR